MFNLEKERINFKQKISSGASGDVYPYQEDADDLEWVVKCIHARDSAELLTYIPEIILGFSCDHPYVLPLKGYSIEKIDQEGYYIYLKFPRMKETLNDKFEDQKKRKKLFPEKEIIKYFYSIVCAVDYLHRKSIYHRDIKPENVLLDAKDNVMLSEAGMAKDVGDEEISQPLTGQEGTVNYTAPELLKDKSQLTKEKLIAGDAWSLGLSMLELCLLKNPLLNPYSALEEIEAVQKSLHDQLKETYSEGLLELIFKLLKLEPNERIKIADLKQILEAKYKFCLGSKLTPENFELKTNGDIENVNSPLKKDKNPEVMEFVDCLRRENSQLQNQLQEYGSFLKRLQTEVLTELDKCENEHVKKLLVTLQGTLKRFQAGCKSELNLVKVQDIENPEEENEMSQELTQDSKTESQDPIPKSQSIFTFGLAKRKENAALMQNQALEKLKKSGRMKVVLTGYSTGGKTSLSHRIVSNLFDPNPSRTIGGTNSQLSIKRNRKKLRLTLWDTADAEVLRDTLYMYLKESLVMIIVYDITVRASFENLPSLIEFQKECTAGPVILFLVGNKLDLESERKVTKEEAQALATKYGGIHFELSAKTGKNVSELQKKVEDAIWEKYYTIAPLNSRQVSAQEKRVSSIWNFLGEMKLG